MTSQTRTPVNVDVYIWITRSVTIQGQSAAETHLNLNSALIGLENPQDTKVTFSKLTLSGSLDIGDIELNLQYVVLRNMSIGQEAFRRVDIDRIMITLKGCLVINSVIANLPARKANSSLHDVRYVALVSYKTRFIASYINITAIETSIRIEQSSMTIEGKYHRRRPVVGLFLYPGQHLKGKKIALRSKVRRSLSNVLSETPRNGRPGATGDWLDHAGTHHDMYSQEHGDRKRRSSDANQNADTNNKILIKDSVFSNMIFTGMSAVEVTSQGNFDLKVQNTTFENNARGLSLVMEAGEAGSLYVSDSHFVNNIASGPGGGIMVDQLGGKLSLAIERCVFDSNVALGKELGTMNDNNRMARVSQITGSGGAIGIHVTADTSKCSADIRFSEFSNNTAQDYGGTLYMTDGVSAHIVGNTFKNVPSSAPIRPRMGELLEFRGNIYNENNTFSVQSAREDIPVIAYRAASDGAFMETYNLDFVCPPGYKAKAVYSAVNLTPSRTSIETLLIFCKPCLDNHYTLDPSAVFVDQSSGLQVAVVSNASCLKCPYGAWCTDDVMAKANFWGEVYDGQVNMYLCPEGYCCQDDICHTYNVCAPHRVGKLCGACAQGYSESVLDSKCMDDRLCGVSIIFWVFVGTYGLLYVLFFVMEEECQVIISSFTTWFMKGLRKCRKRRRSSEEEQSQQHSDHSEKAAELDNVDNEESETERSSLSKNPLSSTDDDDSKCSVSKSGMEMKQEGGGAYMQIFMYFIQVSSLITIDILYQENRKHPMRFLSRLIPNLFGFKSISFQVSTCIQAGMTAVYNVWAKSAFVLYLFGVWFVLFVVASLVNLICCRCCKRPAWVARITLKARFITALINLLLFTYQILAEKALLLLKCIDIKSEGKTVLFIDGTMICYQIWQWYVFLFAISYVFPFCLVLTFAPSLLNRRIISVKTVLACIILPLFGSPVLIFWYYKNRNCEAKVYTSPIARHVSRISAPSGSFKKDKSATENAKPFSFDVEFTFDNENGIDSHSNCNAHKLKGTVESIVGLISDPYRQDLGGGLCWEGMIAFRRLVLVCIATFVYNVLTRQIMIVVVCFFSLLFHYRLRPFLKPACNYLENISLTILVFIGMMNLIKSVYFEAGNIPDGTPDMLFRFYDIVEGVLLGVFPLFLVSLVGILITLRVVAFLLMCGKRGTNRRKSHTQKTTEL